MAVADPLDDLRAEIAADNAKADADAKAAEAATQAAAAGGEQPGEGDETPGDEAPADEGNEPAVGDEAPAGDEQPGEGDEEAAAAAAKAAKDAKPKAKREVLVPASRANEEAAKRRIAERELAAAQAEIAKLKPAKPGETTPPAKTEEQIRAEARAQARLEIQVENFLNEAYSAFGQKEFDDLSASIVDIAGPEIDAGKWLVPMVLEATDTPKDASRAIWALGQQTPEQIEAILKLPPLRLAAKLAQLATARVRAQPAGDEDEPPAPRPKVNGKKVSAAPAPINPVRSAAQASEEFSDSMTDAEFDQLFNKRILHKGSAAQN